ncbi:MAG: UDP-N-acetylmuramoyl-tripeptide--D-alanyl-D-alanine ligase [Elusimicrobia bacterium]|nr:UDP-N-acetylmuramoyl-tripeptide--D-alanyl-D-alanine ligase [Elusimicrobiota bacterium]
MRGAREGTIDLNMTWEELSRCVGGKLASGAPSDRIAAISTDSRAIAPGQVFWALKGQRYDAHEFLTSELAGKSPGWVVAAGALRPGPKPRHVLEVPDTLKALQTLAGSHRRRFEIPIVGITGSNGKTTTKEMVRSICLKVGPTCANEGNLNNQIGLPLSVLELTPRHRYGVFEMGASRPGDIAELGAVAQPTVGVLLNIGSAHLEYFGSLEGTLKAKSELIACVPRDGKIVLNADDPRLAPLAEGLGSRAVRFGKGPRVQVRTLGADTLVIDRRKVRVRLKAFGSINLANAAAAAATAWAMGIDIKTIAEGLEDHRPPAMRLELLSHPSGCEIVLDAYNANPSSMKAAVAAFCSRFPDRGKVLVLGDMKELGPESGRLHEDLGVWLSSLPLRAVFLAGPEMQRAFQALAASNVGFRARHAATPQGWVAELRRELTSDAAVFLKASRSMKFEDIMVQLRA